MKINILFICKFNRFRSQISAGFFHKLDVKKKFNVSSAGLIQGQPISKEVRDIASEYSIKLSKPKGLVRNVLRNQDIIVVAANDVPPSIFTSLKKSGKRRVIVWKVKDVGANKVKDIRRVTEILRKKVDVLYSSLSKN